MKTNDPIYGNVQARQRLTKQDSSIDDDNEGDLIEDELLKVVEEEEQKEIPPALPRKERRAVTSAAILTPHENPTHLDVHLESTPKLVHLGRRSEIMTLFFSFNPIISYVGKDRPRRANVRPPLKKSGDSGFNDSLSDNTRLTDDNDHVSHGDVFAQIPSNPSPPADSQRTESSTS